MAYLTFHKWLVLVVTFIMTHEWYKPKPVTWEKWVCYYFIRLMIYTFYSGFLLFPTVYISSLMQEGANEEVLIQIKTHSILKTWCRYVAKLHSASNNIMHYDMLCSMAFICCVVLHKIMYPNLEYLIFISPALSYSSHIKAALVLCLHHTRISAHILSGSMPAPSADYEGCRQASVAFM